MSVAAAAACESGDINVVETTSIDAQSMILRFSSTTKRIDDGSSDACDVDTSFSLTMNNSTISQNLRDRSNNETELDSVPESLLSGKANYTTSATKDERINLEFSQSVINNESAMNSDKSKDVELTRKLAKLTLDSDCEFLNKFGQLSVEDLQEPLLAGFVTAIAKHLGLIVVKPPMPLSNVVKVGQIIDVFGPTREPYYCVKPVKNGIDLVQEGTRLSYAPYHPRTTFVCFEREEGNRYTLLYSQRWPVTPDQRDGKISGDNRIWSRDTPDDYPRRQYRWRPVGNRRISTEYKNSHKEDLSGLHGKIKPKHSYFHY